MSLISPNGIDGLIKRFESTERATKSVKEEKELVFPEPVLNKKSCRDELRNGKNENVICQINPRE